MLTKQCYYARVHYASHHGNIARVCLARSSEREPVKACNEGNVAAQISFVVVHLRPEWN